MDVPDSFVWSILSKSSNLPADISHGVGIKIIQLRFSYTYNSIKVFRWKSGRVEWERERLAGISITHKTTEQTEDNAHAQENYTVAYKLAYYLQRRFCSSAAGNLICFLSMNLPGTIAIC